MGIKASLYQSAYLVQQVKALVVDLLHQLFDHQGNGVYDVAGFNPPRVAGFYPGTKDGSNLIHQPVDLREPCSAVGAALWVARVQAKWAYDTLI